jgi:hypothetical protein
MSDQLLQISARLAKLEIEHAELLASSAETQARYAALLHMMKEITANAVEASLRASESAVKAMIAGQRAAFAAKEAAVGGAIDIADVALAASRAAADASAASAQAALESWNAALVAAGHNGESELLAMSSQATRASQTATAAAKGALDVFTDAFAEIKTVAAKPVKPV